MAALRVLFVCTANVCRSPVAEHLARRHAGEGDRFSFASAGFLRAGVVCPPKLVDEANRLGIDLSGHHSQVLDRDLVATADLIVTMEARHVVEVSVADPDAFARTVPLKELARLVEAHPGDLDTVRGELEGRDPQQYLGARPDDDVPDPYGGSARTYRQAVGLIDSLVRTVVEGLGPPDRPQGPPGRRPEAVAHGSGGGSTAAALRARPQPAVRSPRPGAQPVGDRTPPVTEQVTAPAGRRRRSAQWLGWALAVTAASWAAAAVLLVIQAQGRVEAALDRLEPLPMVEPAALDVDDTFDALDEARAELWGASRNLENPVLWPLLPVPILGGNLRSDQDRVSRSHQAVEDVTQALEAAVAAGRQAGAEHQQALRRLDEALGDLDQILADTA
jgi:protein-tyrosine phosphatase